MVDIYFMQVFEKMIYRFLPFQIVGMFDYEGQDQSRKLSHDLIPRSRYFWQLDLDE
jgi:hypothetical protein